METASESDAKAPRLLDQVRDTIARKHYSRRTVQDQLGHSSVETTMIYTRAMNKGGRGVTSPLDGIDARG